MAAPASVLLLLPLTLVLLLPLLLSWLLAEVAVVVPVVVVAGVERPLLEFRSCW